ncbi:hypothetical protein [Desulfotomaculum nigrificans]|uniref:hypothetical protein n=1 Tax=Desulfotomaculum nigrificans TaxID=1565 RepID=UPI0001FAEB2C|nr:hypothetical protein [Desulfotomaculum nigrificans]
MGKSIHNYVVEWREKLKECQYVGEIYLNTDELNALAAEFAAEQNVLSTKGYYVMGTAMLVLAVNCAYHYYDNAGFWKHFCSLVRCGNSAEDHEYVGNVIEQTLKHYGLLKNERKGPFRYVGAILEQSGVSKRYIPSTAQIMRYFKVHHGWDYLTSMSLYEFRRRMENTYCSGFLRSFLCDEAGWQFFMQISRLMRQYEEGELTLAELEELPGFQPGFWHELISEFGAVNNSIKNVLTLKPRLVYLDRDKCLALQFPYPQFCENIIFPENATGWEYPLTKLTRAELLSEKYSGKAVGEDGTVLYWTINGWQPDGMPAVFDIRRGYIEANSRIPPGFYYLLAPAGYEVTYSNLQRTGDVNLPGRWKYKAYLVKFEKEDVIVNYSIEDTGVGEQNISLAWQHPTDKLLKYASDEYFDTFEGSLPQLQVSDFGLVEKNIVGLFYNLGKGTVRIKTKQGLKDFSKEVKRHAPVKGRIWLSNIARSGFGINKTVLEELYFCLLPEINLAVEEKIYGFGEEALITADKNSSCQLRFKNCKDISGKGVKWAVPPKESTAYGSIVCGNVSVGIRVPVYRAGLFHVSGERIRYISLSELKEHEKLLLTGYPGAEAKLFVNENYVRTVTFNQEGFGEISCDDLQLTADFNSEISELYLYCQGRKVSTGAVFINLEEIKKSVYQGKPCTIETEWGKNLKIVLQLCTKIVNKPQSHIPINLLPGFCKEIDEWFYTILACACVFDDTVITIKNSVLDWKTLIIDSKKKKLLEYIFNCRRGEDTEFVDDVDTGMLPAVERWIKITDSLTGTDSEDYSKDMFIEWAGDVNGKGPPKSVIAGQKGGKLVTRAWKHYLAGENEKATEIINNINEPAGFVNDLKCLLHSLVLLRMLRISAAKELFGKITPRHKGIRLVYKTLMKALNISDGSIVDSNELLNDMSEILPLRSEDKILIKQCANFDQNSAEAIQCCKRSDDWLLTVIAVEKLKSGTDRNSLIDKLMNLKDQIPESPEKNRLFDKLKTYRGGN